MPSILITGKNSFIGNNFLRFSQNRNIRVQSLIGTAPGAVDFTGIDVVLHLAAIVHVHSHNIAPAEYFRINRDLAIETAKTAKSSGVKHFIFMSTVKVFGDFSSGQIFNETSPCNPQDDYGKSKSEAEQILLELSDQDFCVSIIRTPVVYGNGMKANMFKLEKLIRFFPVLPFKEIDNKRYYTYIENLTGFIDRIIEVRKPGLFLAMDTEPVSTEQLIVFFSKAMNRNVLLFRCPAPLLRMLKYMFPGTVERLFGSVLLNNKQTRRTLSYEPPFSTGEGIDRVYRDRLKIEDEAGLD